MRINEYIKDWCEENYHIEEEKFYTDNAEFQLKENLIKEWRRTAILYFFLIIIMFSLIQKCFDALFYSASVIFGLYTKTLNKYGNTPLMPDSIYLAVILMCILIKDDLPMAAQIIFSVFGIYLFINSGFIAPRKFRTLKKRMKKEYKRKEAEKEQKDKDFYYDFEKQYKQDRYYIPEKDIPKNDPLLEKARELFHGYSDNRELLKIRFRQLAKTYHPDNGGDEQLFQCIASVYEELAAT